MAIAIVTRRMTNLHKQLQQVHRRLLQYERVAENLNKLRDELLATGDDDPLQGPPNGRPRTTAGKPKRRRPKVSRAAKVAALRLRLRRLQSQR